jgi:hypothetical protein
MKLITLPLYLVATLLAFVGGVVSALGWILTCFARTLEEDMKTRLYFALGVVIVLCLLGLSGCVSLPVEPLPVPVKLPVTDMVVEDLPSGTAGRTKCHLDKNEPRIIIDSFWAKSPDFPYILEHEVRHAKNAWLYPGGCWAWIVAYRDSKDFKYREEIDAECAAIATRVKGTRDYYIEEQVRYLMSYPNIFGLRIEEAVRMKVTAVCNREVQYRQQK